MHLNYDDGAETFYELVNGELVEMPPEESELNRRIVMFLVAYFLQQGIPPQRLTMKTEIVVIGSRATTRFPDVMDFVRRIRNRIVRVTAIDGDARNATAAAGR